MPGPVGVVWPESVHRRLRKEAELLIVDLGRAQKKKWMVVGTAMVMVLATTVGVIQWKQEEIRQEMFLREIDQMITERKVDAAEAWLQSEEAARASGKARGAAELAKLKSFLDQERELRKAAEEEMGRTEKNLTNQALDLFTRWKALAGVEKKISLVHPQWRGALEERRNQALSGLRTQSQESQKTRTRTLQDEMKRVAGEFTNWGQATQNRKEDADKLQLLMERLAGGTVWLQQTEPPELAMPVEL